MIESNKELELLIQSIRQGLADNLFESDEEINAYFNASILIFNNLKEPYWKGVMKGEVKYDDYLQSKMDITFANDKNNAINQLFRLWLDKKTSTIEFNLRGLEFIIREHTFEFDKNILKMIFEVLNPFIKRIK
jgi:hypothetical protein